MNALAGYTESKSQFKIFAVACVIFSASVMLFGAND